MLNATFIMDSEGCDAQNTQPIDWPKKLQTQWLKVVFDI